MLQVRRKAPVPSSSEEDNLATTNLPSAVKEPSQHFLPTIPSFRPKPMTKETGIQTFLMNSIPSAKDMKQTEPPKQPAKSQMPTNLEELNLNFDKEYKSQSIGVHMMTGSHPDHIRDESMNCSMYLNKQLGQIVDAIYSFVHNTSNVIEQEVKHMVVANDRLLSKLSNAEQNAVKSRITHPPVSGNKDFNKAVKYILSNLEEMCEKSKAYIGGMGDGAARTLEDIFSIFHSGLYVQNGKYELIHSLIQKTSEFFSQEAARDDEVFLTEVRSQREVGGKGYMGDIPTLATNYSPIQPRTDPAEVSSETICITFCVFFSSRME